MSLRTRMLPFIAILTSAFVWGLIWYPYRALAERGISGELSSVLTYAIALVMAFFAYRHAIFQTGCSAALLCLAIVAGMTNVGFVWATIHGNVLRVLLLFYLLPIWTALWARWLLKEALSIRQLCCIVLGLIGAFLVQWRPGFGLLIPQGASEIVALLSGMTFGLMNVLIRKIQHTDDKVKSFWIFLGCCFVGGVGMCLMLVQEKPVMSLHTLDWIAVALLLILGLLLYVINLVVQYGVRRVPANRASIFFLFELPIGALSAWLLVDEHIGIQELIGGGCIVLSGLLSHEKDG